MAQSGVLVSGSTQLPTRTSAQVQSRPYCESASTGSTHVSPAAHVYLRAAPRRAPRSGFRPGRGSSSAHVCVLSPATQAP